MQSQNPQLFQKAQEMTQGKNEEQLKQTVLNLANQQGIDINAFASQFGININNK